MSTARVPLQASNHVLGIRSPPCTRPRANLKPRSAIVPKCQGGAEGNDWQSKVSDGAQRFAPGIGSTRGVLPTRLLGDNPSGQSQPQGQEMTVYSVRLTTSTERGSYLTSTNGGVWMCLVGEDGSSMLHRFSPVVDPEDLQEQLKNICETDSWEEIGADCSVSDVPVLPTKNVAKRRFNEGSVDEESFVAPDLGPLAAIIVGPEEGAWRLHEVIVSSSRTGQSDRFVCRQRMGEGQKDRSAAYLTPVPENAVVYGSGESAVILSKDEAARLNSASMRDYSQLKDQLVQTNLALVASGSGVMALIGGLQSFAAFGVGGMLGVMYQLSVQSAVDNLPSSLPEEYDTNPMDETSLMDNATSAISTVLSKPPARFLMTAGAAACAFYAAEMISSGGVTEIGAEVGVEATSGSSRAGLLPSLLAMMAGFMMHKVSIIAVSMQPLEREKETQGIIARKKAE